MNRVLNGIVISAITAMALTVTGCNKAGPVACNAFVDTVADRFVACGATSTKEEIAAVFEEAITMDVGPDGCDEIVGVDDDALFYDECIPGIEALSCADLMEGSFPRACDGQLLFFRR